ncbi:RDD family protein [Undibacterium sp. TJN25]|uniref:RDD family protein n=1 Tax=Undibacterium sp. TJN25 TaxID=3413056 RepID=UPI003BF1A7C0
MDTDELEYVGFGPRFWAFIVDSVLITVLLLVLLLVVYDFKDLSSGVMLTGWTSIFLNYVLPALIVLAFWILKSATPGKMAIGAKIVDADTGLPPSMRQHIIRYVGYFVSMIPFFLGFLWIVFDNRKQGWHDKMAGTVVVRPKNHGNAPVKFQGTTSSQE